MALKLRIYEVIGPRVDLLKDVIEHCRYRQKTEWRDDIDGESTRKYLSSIGTGEKMIEVILPAILDHETPIKYTDTREEK